MGSRDSFRTRGTLQAGGREYTLYRLAGLKDAGFDVDRLPYSLKILLENLLRTEDGTIAEKRHIEALASWKPDGGPDLTIPFLPARVLLQDFTGVPAVVDLAAMRDAVVAMGGDPDRINPLLPAELVIDHSVQVDAYGTPEAYGVNIELEFERNRERYALLRWGQKSFDNFRVVPPGTGICHQVNLEHLSRVVFDREEDGTRIAFPDTLVGTDSHTPMVNGLGVLGWGVGGIEAEAAMLGQPFGLPYPQVIGFKLFGSLPAGTTATDLVLTIAQRLRKKGAVGKFVEFFGKGLSSLALPDRATIGNMSPEYGATCAIFPIDAITIEYLRLSGRDEARVALVEAYAKEQGLFRTDNTPDPLFSDTLELDLSTVVPSLAGPRRPQDRVSLTDMKRHWAEALPTLQKPAAGKPAGGAAAGGKATGATTTGAAATGAAATGAAATGGDAAGRSTTATATSTQLEDGHVVLAAITSCTNTSNPSVMIGAGLLARNAAGKGLEVKPWVKTSLAPGSRVVTEYLRGANLLKDLEKLRFHLVGYGCTTCIGNSGPLPEPVRAAIHERNLVAVSVLSGNRNFEGRINPDVRANYLASPPLVVAYALAGRIDIDFEQEPLGKDRGGTDVFLRDIWPDPEEIRALVGKTVTSEMFSSQYADVFTGDDRWRALPVPEGSRFAWDENSTYVQQPPFFKDMAGEPEALRDIEGARVLVMLGDSVTTDHISPAGSIHPESPAGRYLIEHGVEPKDFNSYGARRGNHEVMIRGTFANVRLRNRLAPGTEGGWTEHVDGGGRMSIYDTSLRYEKEGVPLLVLAGKEYGSGSSRDWAAKGTAMLGIRAVIAESYERIHRSNLIGMGVLPLQFVDGGSIDGLGLTGRERFTVRGIEKLEPGARLEVSAEGDGGTKRFSVLARVDSPIELEYYRHGGILRFVLRQMLAGSR